MMDTYTNARKPMASWRRPPGRLATRFRRIPATAVYAVEI